MNAYKKKTTLSIPIPIKGVVALLLFGTLMSAFGLVYIKDTNRRLTGQLQSLQTENQNVKEQYSQLLLEKGAWASNARIETIATKQLHMIVPPTKLVVII